MLFLMGIKHIQFDRQSPITSDGNVPLNSRQNKSTMDGPKLRMKEPLVITKQC